jgi:type IV pilus assembly protein PilB
MLEILNVKFDEENLLDRKYASELELQNATDYITDEQKAKNPIISDLLKIVIDEAIELRTTDIQISIPTQNVMVRYRIDSKMINYRLVEREAFDALSCRVKFLGGMDIKEARSPQDGRFTHRKDGVAYDIRVSTIPTNKGENISLRLLYNSDLSNTLDDLNLRPNVLEKYRNAIMSREGLILLTGPTGSGKTTTLYTTIGELIEVYGESKNIMTIEDPIEYEVDKIVQSQVNLIRNYDFQDGLRSILRQNPDIILVGEIRDKNTAETAVRASNTGHLVFSTLHASDAVSTAIVMKQLGVEPYNISNSLKIVINQRLTGKLCVHCKIKRLSTAEERVLFPGSTVVYDSSAGDCVHCGGNGYLGLVLIMEMLVVDDVFRDLIFKNMTSTDMKVELMKSDSYYSLKEDLIAHLKDGNIAIKDAIHLS